MSYAKRLPSGSWISFRGLAPETSEQDLSDLIAARTGVVVPVEHIAVNEYHGNAAGAIVSFSNEHLRDILRWALQDETLHDRPLQVVTPERARNGS